MLGAVFYFFNLYRHYRVEIVNCQLLFSTFFTFRRISQLNGGDFVFSDNYIRLCNSIGKGVTVVAEELGYSAASGAKWANGSTPRQTTLLKIANYFGVTVEELKAETEKPVTENGNGQKERNQKLIELFESLPVDRQLAVIRQLQEITRLQKAQDDLLRF